MTGTLLRRSILPTTLEVHRKGVEADYPSVARENRVIVSPVLAPLQAAQDIYRGTILYDTTTLSVGISERRHVVRWTNCSRYSLGRA